MSSLRDIMDVDVEPLPQTLRKSTREHTTPEKTTADQLTSPPKEQHRDDHGKAAIKRRKSNRPGQVSASEASSTQGESSTATASMDPNSQYGVPGSHRHTSATSSTRHSSRSSDVPEGTVKYTPVTGRVSRAKKGQPVHVCEICKPSKTFTRAEHLRRHQLSHTKPAFPCTFQDCERAFHRPDLLARHMNRHETQGEKAFKASKARSRASSADSSSRLGTPMLKVEEQPSPSNTPSNEPMNPVASTANPTTHNQQFLSTKAESPAPSNERNYSLGRQPEAIAGVGAMFRESVPPPDEGLSSFNQLTSGNMNPTYYSESSLFQIPVNYQFSSFQPADDLPSNLQLQIPEQPYPGLYTQDNNSSPWYGSDSPYSTPSDGSRTGRWEYRDRSVSIATVPDHGYVPPTPWSPPRASSGPGNNLHGRSPGFENISEQVEDISYLSPNAAPRMSLSAQVGYNVETGSVRSSSRSSNRVLAGQPMGYKHQKTVVAIEPMDGYQVGWRASGFQVQLEPYLSAYWRFFDPLWPVIHRSTFNPDASPTLRLAMAAIGTQFFGRSVDREVGSDLHKDCKKMIGLSPSPDVHAMQAILLTEIFARFRSQKIDISPSKAFKALYDYLLEKVSTDDASPFSRMSADGLQALAATRLAAEPEPEPLLHTRIWHEWIAYEIRQRLRSACFMFDVHQSMYYEQPPSRPDVNVQTTKIIFPCPNDIWEAGSPSEWCSKISFKGGIEDSLEGEIEHSHYREHLLICSLLSILPHRDLSKIPKQDDEENRVISTSLTNSIVSHGYLQFYYAPLRDILAITGDTWVLGRKVKTQAEFEGTKRRLYQWSTSLQAAKATWHACHVLELALTTRSSTESSDTAAVCAYWAVYTAALICWAFGHRKAVCNVVDERGAEPEATAAAYVAMMTGSKWQDLLSMPSNRGELAVVHVVKQRLEIESIGGKCGMLVDATAVLSRITEGRGGKWF